MLHIRRPDLNTKTGSKRGWQSKEWLSRPGLTLRSAWSALVLEAGIYYWRKARVGFTVIR